MFPHVINPYIAVLPILFVTPVQWNAFGTAGGYASATVFSSNNVRQATTSLVSYIMDKDKKMLEKTRFYWMTLLCFHAGAALSCCNKRVLQHIQYLVLFYSDSSFRCGIRKT